MKSLLLFAVLSLSLTSCANRPLTADEQKAIATAEDVALSGIAGYATGGKTGALIGASSAFKRNFTSAKQPLNVQP
jgi:hypothetical protein